MQHREEQRGYKPPEAGKKKEEKGFLWKETSARLCKFQATQQFVNLEYTEKRNDYRIIKYNEVNYGSNL